jgi:hypothetical protein
MRVEIGARIVSDILHRHELNVFALLGAVLSPFDSEFRQPKISINYLYTPRNDLEPVLR